MQPCDFMWLGFYVELLNYFPHLPLHITFCIKCFELGSIEKTIKMVLYLWMFNINKKGVEHKQKKIHYILHAIYLT